MLHLTCDEPQFKIIPGTLHAEQISVRQIIPSLISIQFESTLSYLLLISPSANDSSRQEMGSAGAHVSTGILP